MSKVWSSQLADTIMTHAARRSGTAACAQSDIASACLCPGEDHEPEARTL
jgi:hypothetical protein